LGSCYWWAGGNRTRVRQKFGTFDPTDIKRLGELEAENAKLKRMLAEREMAGCRQGSTPGVRAPMG